MYCPDVQIHGTFLKRNFVKLVLWGIIEKNREQIENNFKNRTLCNISVTHAIHLFFFFVIVFLYLVVGSYSINILDRSGSEHTTVIGGTIEIISCTYYHLTDIS